MLAIAPGALFFDQQVRQPRTIQNSGSLTAGRDLTLSANNLELQGEVRSGGNLTLQAQDTVRIRDSVTNPFIAEAGGRLLVQSDRGIDIFALNHPQSGFFSGKDMILRSSNAIAGDARFWSGGNFRIEQLDHSLGNLFSPTDPIIRSVGDVSLNNYFGASLHILAGGSVTAGDIEIIDADPSSAIAETITLSNGTQVAIDGRTQPTLDIRAGIDPNKIGSPLGVTGNNGIFLDSTSFNLSSPIITPTPTSSAINVR